jgi:hypothetical protein
VRLILRINMGKFFKKLGGAIGKVALKTLKTGVDAAPAAIAGGGIPGAIIGIVGSVLSSVVNAEDNYPATASEAKRLEVERTFETIGQICVPLIEAMTGRDVDDARVSSGLAKIMEGLIDLLKGFRVFDVREVAAK